MCLHKPKQSKSLLNVLSFNVEGLASELEDPTFVDLLYKHDICLLNETWRADDSKLALPDFWDFSLVRPKHKKAGRHSGGITVLCKEEYRPGIKIAQSVEGFIWLRLDGRFLNLKMMCIYVQPTYPQKTLLRMSI
jgi:exonuclease III